MSKIIVFSESGRLLTELVSGAVKLGGSVCAAAIGSGAEEYIKYGAEKVYALEENSTLPIEAYAEPLESIIRAESADIVMIGATVKGKSIAALLAQGIGAGASTDCRNLRMTDKGLQVDRMVYGGAAVSTEVCRSAVYFVTVPPLTFELGSHDGSRTGEVVSVKTETDYPARVVDRSKAEADDVDITLASAVIAVGRGLDRQDDIQMAEELAGLLGGVVGCSRPIAADNHWMSNDRYIGLSGKSVKPKLYVAIGISGQIQHIASAKDSKTIVAVNKDKSAPIFKASDFGVVGDLYEVVPELIRKLKELKS